MGKTGHDEGITPHGGGSVLDVMRSKYPEKFTSEEKVFSHVNRGDRIFIGTFWKLPLISYL